LNQVAQIVTTWIQIQIPRRFELYSAICELVFGISLSKEMLPPFCSRKPRMSNPARLLSGNIMDTLLAITPGLSKAWASEHAA
jgi:hypothetical protein